MGMSFGMGRILIILLRKGPMYPQNVSNFICSEDDLEFLAIILNSRMLRLQARTTCWAPSDLALGSVGNRRQDFIHAIQAFCQLNHIPGLNGQIL